MNLIIDVGNTLLKLAVFDNQMLTDKRSCDKVDFIYGWFDYGLKTTLYPHNSYPLGPSFLIKKSLLKKFGIFNPNLGLSGSKETVLRGEETDLAVRFRNNGIHQYYCGESLVYHNVSEKRLNKEWFIARSSIFFPKPAPLNLSDIE